MINQNEKMELWFSCRGNEFCYTIKVGIKYSSEIVSFAHQANIPADINLVYRHNLELQKKSNSINTFFYDVKYLIPNVHYVYPIRNSDGALIYKARTPFNDQVLIAGQYQGFNSVSYYKKMYVEDIKLENPGDYQMNIIEQDINGNIETFITNRKHSTSKFKLLSTPLTLFVDFVNNGLSQNLGDFYLPSQMLDSNHMIYSIEGIDGRVYVAIVNKNTNFVEKAYLSNTKLEFSPQ